jgi:hypothetical protein
MKKTAVYLAALMLAALFLNGCSNLFLEKSRNDSGGENTAGASVDIPEGFGTVTVSLTRGAARTVMPMIELSSLYLEYLFVKDGEAAVEKTPDGEKFVLEPGSYSLTVQVFAESAKQNLVAQGTTDEDFTIDEGIDTGVVNLSLHPVVSGTGTGELEFNLEYPAGVTVESLTLTRIAGEESPIDLTAVGTDLSPGLSGTKTDIPVGYYLLQAILKNSGGDYTGRTEVAHIYQNLKAAVTYVFIADDFRAYRVTSAADTGPGSLRQAITNAMTMTGPQTIQVVLEPGTVIELGSSLPEVTKSLTIEGNGVTLTRVGTWTDIYNDTLLRLLRITDAAAEVLVRRIHFKNGLVTSIGGAIYNEGILTLESCIFSGNQPKDRGGALYSANTLTVRGCTFYGNTTAGSYGGGAVYFYASGKTLTLTGNLFYGNTSFVFPVVDSAGGSINASYNGTDTAFGTNSNRTGWYAGTGDTIITVLPISPLSFRLLYGGEAVGKLPGTLPADYPVTDFYGDPVSGGGAAGAVQASTEHGSGYYYLETSVNNSLGGSVTVSSPPDADGLYPADSIITPSPNSGYSLGYWLVNRVDPGMASISLSTHTWVRAVFNRAVTVNVFTDGAGSVTTPGTLRHALTNVEDGDRITLSGVMAGTTTIALESALPEITKSLTIEGNGATLTRAASWTAGYDTHLLSITGDTTEVLLRRIHFKDGLTTNNGNGAAIYNTGILTLESCIFSGNRAMTTTTYSGGGALSSGNNLTVRGCTFYGNITGSWGGAVYISSSVKTLTLTGNLFYRNSAASYPVVYRSSATINASYNVVDTAFGTGNTQAGWAAGTGDTTTNVLPVSPLSFKLLYGSEAEGKLPGTLPAGYPDTDFYGNPISGGGAAGAVQGSTAHGNGYYYLETSVNNSLWGSVTVNSTPDENGLYPEGSIIITPTPTSGYSLRHWLVNGVKSDTAPTNLSAHIWVQAVFSRAVAVFTDGTGPGTLRHALTNAEDGDIITISGVIPGTTIIELEGALPEITKSLTIEGNGVTLTRAASWDNSQLLRINGGYGSKTCVIRRIHFKNGLARNNGGAIYNNGGILTLESCIFSGNQTTDYTDGGAVYSNYTMTIRGCTFYRNTANGSGGAVFFSSASRTLTLTGNLFYGNTASGPVVRINSGTANASYNVVDVALGMEAGWSAGIGDNTTTAPLVLPMSFKLLYGSGAENRLPGTLPADYPVTDFYGDPISGEGAAGAVQKNTVQGYYYLELSVNNSLRGSITVSSSPGADLLYPAGSTITANANSGYSFGYWLVNGEKSGAAFLNLSAHSRVQAVFNRAVMVNDFSDEVGSAAAPTLRYALINADDGDVITMNGTAGTTVIELKSALPEITKSLTIEGNGVTLTRAASWTDSSYYTQLLRITDSTAEILVRRVQFKEGMTEGNGVAIFNQGILTLESCIFSGNRTSDNGLGYGGALFSVNTLTIRGCTFYSNRGRYGGAVFFDASGRTLTLTGNLFYGNTAQYSVVFNGDNSGSRGAINASYNVVDVAYGTGNTQAGWDAGTGDTTFTALGISGDPFDTTTFVPVAGLQSSGVLPSTAPPDFPATDFYGAIRTFPGAPGAVAAAP